MCYVYENQMATDQLPPVCWPFIAKASIQLFTHSTRAHILIKELSYSLLSIKLSNNNFLLSQLHTNQLFTHSTRAHILIKELSYPLLVIQSSNKNSLQAIPLSTSHCRVAPMSCSSSTWPSTTSYHTAFTSPPSNSLIATAATTHYSLTGYSTLLC